MLESLINFDEIQRKPYIAFFWAIILTSVGIVVSFNVGSIPGAGIGVFSVLFTIIPSVYFMTMIIKKDEETETKEASKGKYERKSFWERHSTDILTMIFFFLGAVVAFSIWSYALPQGTFDSQVGKITQIKGTGAMTEEGMFGKIFANNVQVLVLSFIFSFIFGAGAVFIIIWNASVLGVYIGQLSKSALHIPLLYLTYLPHGLPEIAGYLFAALAGGILSSSIIRKRKWKTIRFVAIDSAKLLLIGISLIALAAVIEVFL